MTGGPPASGGLLLNQGNLGLINTELKSAVIFLSKSLVLLAPSIVQCS